jgi:hypothetical protein
LLLNVFLFIALTKPNNMKKIINSFIIAGAVSALIFSSGCKKAATIDGHVASYTETKTVTGQTPVTTTTTLTYDAQNRLTEIQATNSTPTTYSYGSGTVTQIQGANQVIFQLNGSGLATSDNVGDVWVYDNNGYNTNYTNVGQGVSAVLTISNGNLTSQQYTQNNVTSTTSYTYLTTTDYRNYGQAFFGKNSVDLENSESTSPANTSKTFSYTFDSKGRVQTQTYISGTTNDVTTYTYTTN